jgi:adenine specific DNA methylase Mod
MNRLYYGDNLDVLREQIATESVDLIYLDPPFNSNANYNILFKSPTGAGADAQIEAFEDSWHWNDSAEAAFDAVLKSGNTKVADMLIAMIGYLGRNDMMAYLAMMAVRLIELHRVLKSTGSLYLHCDPTASHYLKILLDGVFGPQQFLNEVIWKRTSAHSSAKRYGPVHDTILYYAKSARYCWNKIFTAHDPDYVDLFFDQTDEDGRRWKRMDMTGAGTRNGQTGKVWRGIDVTAKGRHWAYLPSKMEELDAAGRVHWPAKSDGMPRLKQYPEDLPGVPLQDVFADIKPMHNLAQERLGYPTQKPLALLERIIAASSNLGDVVLDPFCGCGTAVDAAEKLGRRWLGIDVTHLSISLIEKRMKDRYPGIAFEVIGTPKDLASAIDLAARDKYQFQWWAVSLVDAQPFGGKKKGADGGIDGIIYFKPDGKTTERCIVSVKGGDNVGVAMVKDLGATMAKEKAAMGIFLTLALPTKPMREYAASVGVLHAANGKAYPRLQIVTLAELFQGLRPSIPYVDVSAAFKKAGKDTAKQGDLGV